ncbi:MAG: hypothetical protein RR851_10245 [Clostridium sp.]
MEDNIIISDGLSIKQLRQLEELSQVNRVLNEAEFLKIVSVYNEAIERVLLKESESNE